MLQQNIGGPTTGNQPTTSSIIQQNTGLLGTPQVPAAPPISDLSNNTAPLSSTTDPNTAAIVKALKGGM